MPLLPYQEPSADKLEKTLATYGVGVDGSDPGVGKTYVNAEVVRRTGRPVGVVCPKVAVPVWERTLKMFGVTPLFVIGYEKLKGGKTPWGCWKARQWQWNLPPDTVIIFDEVHRCKSPKSQNAMMLRDSRGIPLLLLSATIAENPLDMRALAHVLGLTVWGGWYAWLLRHGCRKGRFGFEFNPKLRGTVLPKLHHEIFGLRGSRIRIADLGDAFPETQISAEAYDLGESKAIQAAYEEMEAELLALAEASEDDNETSPLTIRLRARQKTELLKIPGICSMAQDLVEEGMHVVIFTNFRASLQAACDKLKTGCAIYGGQKAEERQQAIDAFQDDREPYIIVNIEAGGVALSLHDLNGRFPRAALLCPSDSAIQLKQALGRVHRSGGKSKSIQRLIFAADTIEEKICDRVNEKLKNLDLLNDGDLSLSEGSITHKLPKPMTEDAQAPTKREEALQSIDTAVVVLPPNHGERAHAKHSPSKFTYLAKCEGFFSDPNGDKSFADRGTRGHEMVENETPQLILDDPALRTAVEKCVFIKRTLAAKGRLYQEIRLKVLDQFGFIDIFVDCGDHGYLIDWKFAHNLYYADSGQFWGYCVGIWDDPRFVNVDEIHVMVAHPFLDIIDEVTFSRTKDYDRLSAACANLIFRAENPDQDRFRVGKHCTYCGRIKNCKAWADLGMEIANRYATDEDKFKLPAGPLHGSEIEDPHVLALLYRIAPLVTKAAEGWRKAALEKRLAGIDIPGYDLAERRGSRSITNMAGAWEAVKDRVKVEDLLPVCSVGIGDLETLFAASFPRGEKGASKAVLMDALIDKGAVSSGAPVLYLREIKEQH